MCEETPVWLTGKISSAAHEKQENISVELLLDEYWASDTTEEESHLNRNKLDVKSV